MSGKPQKLELTWFNKDKALIPTETGKYGYTWVDPKDPRYCETHTLVIDEVVTGTQAPKEDETTYSERADLEPTDDNLLITGESGDVLEALTRVPELAEQYVGQVKCIYIDPPFNTAQTFPNYEDNLEHSIWLTMMRDRLVHLRQLLSDDGSIWVHLDDVENHRMRVLMDEVFGAANYVAEMVWHKSYSSRNDSSGIPMVTDSILIYRKSDKFVANRLPRTEEMNALYSNPDNDPRGPWAMDNPGAPTKGLVQHASVFGIQHPITGEMQYPSSRRCWAFSQDKLLEIMQDWGDYELGEFTEEERAAREVVCGPGVKIREDIKPLVIPNWGPKDADRARRRYEAGAWPTFILTKDGIGGFRRKRFLSEVAGRVPTNLLRWEEVGHNDTAIKEIRALFPTTTAFTTPKPERLLERILHIATDPGDLVLDVFAGSGTTAAVAQKMGRRWVTCELVKDTVERFTLPRLTKVVCGEDPGGITLTKGERVDNTDNGLPEGLSPDEAQQLTSLLNKALRDEDNLKKNAGIKALKNLVKTRKSKDTVNWRGGGSFVVARLSPSCFDYDPDLDLVTLTEAATGYTLVASVAANLNFRLTPEHRYFHGVRGMMRLVVVEGRLDQDKVDDLVAHLECDEGLTIAATEIEDGVRQYLRTLGRGCRAVHIPNDLFPYRAGKED